ncbi:hypothetical protein CR513_35911, partial [Mucuna pruriens]
MDKLTSGLDQRIDAIISKNALTEKLSKVAKRHVSIVERQVLAIKKCNGIIHKKVMTIKQRTTQVYSNSTYSKAMVDPKIMDFQFFDSNGFEFQNLFKVQGLHVFVQLDNAHFSYLVKVFYNNLTISSDAIMIKLGVEVRTIKSAGNLTIKDRLLHYTYVHILIPCGAIMHKEQISYYIYHYMHKGKEKPLMPLPYCILITKILEYHGIDSVGDGEITPD